MPFFLFHVVALLSLTLAAALPKAGTSRQTCADDTTTGQWGDVLHVGHFIHADHRLRHALRLNNFSAGISVELENSLGSNVDKARQRHIWVRNEDTGDEAQLVILDANATRSLGM